MEPSAADIAALVDRLRRPRIRPAVGRAIAALDRVGRRLRDPADAWRADTVAAIASGTGMARAMVEAGLHAVARQFDRAGIESALRAEFGDPAILDEPIITPGGGRRGVLPPAFLFEILPGNTFAASATAVVRALLLRAPVLFKCAAVPDLLAPRLLAALAAEDADLVAAAAAVHWPGGDVAREAPVLAAADVVVVHGEAATIADVQRRARPGARVIGYGPRGSLAVIAADGAPAATLPALAAGLARDVALYEQRGCLSVQAVLVESAAGAAGVADALADALRRLETEWPPAPTPAERAAVAQARGVAAMRAGARVIPAGAAAVVEFANARDPWPTPGGRFVPVVPLRSPADAEAVFAGLRDRLQGVALSAGASTAAAWHARLAAARVPWICRPGELQSPPIGWPQDGRPAFADLVTFTEQAP